MQTTDQATAIAGSALEKSIASAADALLGFQQADGHWVFELEADDTIPAEYVLLRPHLGEPVDAVLGAKIANYIKRRQGTHGGWSLVQDGPFDISASVKAYFALKMIGHSIDAPHMARARDAICSPRGRDPQQCLHPFSARDVRRHDLAQRAGAADRDHAAADVVAVPS